MKEFVWMMKEWRALVMIDGVGIIYTYLYTCHIIVHMGSMRSVWSEHANERCSDDCAGCSTLKDRRGVLDTAHRYYSIADDVLSYG